MARRKQPEAIQPEAEPAIKVGSIFQDSNLYRTVTEIDDNSVVFTQHDPVIGERTRLRVSKSYFEQWVSNPRVSHVPCIPDGSPPLKKASSKKASQPAEQPAEKNDGPSPHINLRCAVCGYYAKTTQYWHSLKRLRCPIDGAELQTAKERGEKRGRG